MMDDLFERFGKRLADTVDEWGKKAEDTIDIQKLKARIHSLKRANERDYQAIGRQIYEQFKSDEPDGIDHLPLCEAIAQREEKIKEHEREIEGIKGV